jgi:hypothetical protein
MICGMPASLWGEFPHSFTTKKRTTFRIGHTGHNASGSGGPCNPGDLFELLSSCNGKEVIVLKSASAAGGLLLFLCCGRLTATPRSGSP